MSTGYLYPLSNNERASARDHQTQFVGTNLFVHNARLKPCLHRYGRLDESPKMWERHPCRDGRGCRV